MSRRKIARKIFILIITIIFLLILTIATFVGTIFLASKGIIFRKFLGLELHYWIMLILGSSIIAIMIWYYVSIQRKKKKYGKLKFRLKSKEKTKRVIVFLVLLIILFWQASILSSGFTEFDSDMILLLFLTTPIILVYSYTSIQKEGLGEAGVFYSGDVYQWDKISSYSLKENIITLGINKKFFRRDDIFEIQFVIEVSDMDDIEKFLCERLGK